MSTTTIGRFAPSPTGPLHFGSLIAALGSWLSARAVGGRWHLRIDDLDPDRSIASMADTIELQLEAFGLTWDGPILFQSERIDAYVAALEQLQTAGVLYRCTCTRREIGAGARYGPLGAIYAGTCRNGPTHPERDAALRLRLSPGRHEVIDRIQGTWSIDADRIGDVIVRRRNGVTAYHLATTVDDAFLGVTDIVRGSDLLPAAVIQEELQRRLHLPAPGWAHLPVMMTPDGTDKLSKQTGAPAVDPAHDPVTPLVDAWCFLGQTPPPEPPATPAEFLTWALPRWDESRIPPGERLVAGGPGGGLRREGT
ncbi:MAG: tRNA glutamyl-Q(34) synthetase GluQRS [Halofilum sp. (in: g-proteobacteria)]|nr:tRNA glutamyl-Q(34) synthetase GluQRS [Halofilum sp. (in: g-proteobacteria)]